MQAPEIQAALRQAAACYQAGDHRRAEALYRQVIAAAPSAVYLADLGAILAAGGKGNEAVAALNEAITLDPKAAEPHYKLGNIYRGWGKAEEAEHSYRSAIALDPRHGDALNNLG